MPTITNATPRGPAPVRRTFDGNALPEEFQWLRTPDTDRIFRLGDEVVLYGGGYDYLSISEIADKIGAKFVRCDVGDPESSAPATGVTVEAVSGRGYRLAAPIDRKPYAAPGRRRD